MHRATHRNSPRLSKEGLLSFVGMSFCVSFFASFNVQAKRKSLKPLRFKGLLGAAGRIRTADLILTKGDFPLIYTKSNHKYNVNGIQAGGYTVAMNPRSQA